MQLIELESLRKTVNDYKEREREELEGASSDDGSDDDSKSNELERRTSMRKSSYMKLRAESGEMGAEIEMLRNKIQTMQDREEEAKVHTDTLEKDIKRLRQMLDRCLGGKSESGGGRSSSPSGRLLSSESFIRVEELEAAPLM